MLQKVCHKLGGGHERATTGSIGSSFTLPLQGKTGENVGSGKIGGKDIGQKSCIGIGASTR